mmetsp:Transcript_7995/g.29557  ORF Transcript_7995/g.29557 Transcript_7995/m.29557 type:complete len:842 (-) Transcript_7995:210-2735(-)
MKAPFYRVKVYRLNNEGKWDDRGTGHINVQYLESSDAVGIVVISEGHDANPLLVHGIHEKEIYHRQGEDTIITWNDADLGTELAISFEDTAGCDYIWSQISVVQQGYVNGERRPEKRQRGGPAVDEYESQLIPGMQGQGQQDGAAYGGASGIGASAISELPAPEMGNLEAIAKLMSEVSAFQRDRYVALLLRDRYLERLLCNFQQCEDLEDLPSLHNLFRIVKNTFLLNDTNLMEILFSEEHVTGVLGILEYDPDLPAKQNHREFLSQKVVFKEVVPIENQELRLRIHQTYRIGYVKDVILPRVLDDGTAGQLQSLMLFNFVEVITRIHQDPHYLDEYFRRFLSWDPSEPDWLDYLKFLQELCSHSRHLHPPQRARLLSKLARLGLFDIVTVAFKQDRAELRLSAADILISTLNHDAAMLRNFLAAQENHVLFTQIIDFIVNGDPSGVQTQLLDAMRVLLEVDTIDPNSQDRDAFLDLFYDQYVGKLVAAMGPAGKEAPKVGHVASEQAWLLSAVLDLLCFCVANHGYRIKYYILRNNVVEKVLRLTTRKEASLNLGAIRFFRTCLGVKDDFYNRYIMKHNLFEPILNLFISNGQRYNLINSAILELFVFILNNQIRNLIKHVIENYGEKIADITYVSTFQDMRNRYEALVDQERQQAGRPSAGRDQGRRPDGSEPAANAPAWAARRKRDARELDRDEENYFSTDDDDNDDASHGGNQENAPPAQTLEPSSDKANSGTGVTVVSDKGVVANGASTGSEVLGGLVDYGSDEDEKEASEANAQPARVDSREGILKDTSVPADKPQLNKGSANEKLANRIGGTVPEGHDVMSAATTDKEVAALT